MKKYNQFINEAIFNNNKINSILPSYIVFYIKIKDPNRLLRGIKDIRIIDDPKERNVKKFIEEVKKYFDILDGDYFMNKILRENSNILEIELYVSAKRNAIHINNWNYEDYKINFVNIIKLEEFLEIGFEGIEEYFEMKNAAKNFNL